MRPYTNIQFIMEAENGEDLIQKIPDSQPDIVLCDLKMPIKDGIDATVSVVRQADRSVRVQFDTRGAIERDPGLSNRFSQAYERRMGR